MKLRKVPSRTKTALRSANNTNSSRLIKSSRKGQSLSTKIRTCVCVPQRTGPIEFPSIWTEFRNNNQLCDGVVYCEDGVEFRVHRAILSAVSPYFKVRRNNVQNDKVTENIVSGSFYEFN